MKKTFFALAALLLAVFTAATPAHAVKIRIMSFNIRCINDGDAPENQWERRPDRLCEYIKEVKPGLFGMQEVTPKQLADVKARMTDYDCISAGRDNGTDQGESTPIFYLKDKYRVVKTNYFWLSETPEKPSYGWGSACRRIALLVLFEDIKSGKQFIFCNTHFDHVSLEARKESAKLLKDRFRAIAPDAPFILSADFNTNEKEETYSLLVNHAYPCVDTWKVAKKSIGGPATYTAWGKLPNVADHKIDFIFTSEKVKVKKAVIAPPYNKLKEYYSDHNAIWCDLSFK